MKIKEKIVRELINNPKETYTKFSLREILAVNDVEYFNSLIKELSKENILYIDSKKKLHLSKNLNNNIFIGKFLFNTKGYGFCIKLNPNEQDGITELFIPPSKINNAMHEDIVIARITNTSVAHNNKVEGEIVSILERGITKLVGTFIPSKNYGFVIPDNPRYSKDIYIPLENFNGANAYDKVSVNITKFPYNNRKPEGIIDEVIGFKYDKGVDVDSIIIEYELRDVFPRKVIQQVDKLSKPSDVDLKYRKDLTNLTIYTIDGEDSKDLDDAISLELLDDDTYRLGVHIADVTHYVKEKSPLDKEALERGTSVYLINKVLPMLPKKLSNGLCSLNQGEIKLTLSVFMNINKNGDVIDYNICESYIKSKARLCYKEVTSFIEGTGTLAVSEEVKKSLILAKALAKILENKRINRGALEFNFKESHIDLDENNVPINVEAYERGIANDIIEEFMIVTNETVAKHFCDLDMPFVYRIHEKPKQEKLDTFMKFISKLGYEIPMDLSPKSLQNILFDSKGKPEEEAVNLLLLKCMQQARYYPVEMGHFGLGAEYYSHFTSPIRRYPDLQIHRIIKEHIHNTINTNRKNELIKIVDMTSKISSKREREAQKAELAYDAYKKAEYMTNKMNEYFDATVIAISKSRIKVSLDNTIEGYITTTSLDNIDKFTLVEDNCILKGDNKSIIIGDKIKVKPALVNLETKEIYFDLIEFTNSQNLDYQY